MCGIVGFTGARSARLTLKIRRKISIDTRGGKLTRNARVTLKIRQEIFTDTSGGKFTRDARLTLKTPAPSNLSGAFFY